MVVIEHNLEVIKTADWVIDLGPEAGIGGGYAVAEGTPEEIIKVPRSHTGKFLKPVLEASPRGKLGIFPLPIPPPGKARGTRLNWQKEPELAGSAGETTGVPEQGKRKPVIDRTGELGNGKKSVRCL